MDGAQRFERGALERIVDRCLGPVYELAHALTGDEAAAEAVTAQALARGLDRLPGFGGDEREFEVVLLVEAVAGARRRAPGGVGLRHALADLGRAEYQVVAMRVLAGVDTDTLAAVTGTRHSSLRAQLASALRALDGQEAGPALGWGWDLEPFDAAVDRVLRGGRPEAAAAPVRAPTDVLTLLRRVALLGGVEGRPPTPATAARLRSGFLVAAGERRVLWVQRHQAPPTVPGAELRRIHPLRSSANVAALGLAVVLALMVGVALAVLAAFADPDSTFYPLKKLGESTLLTIDRDPLTRSELEVKLSQTREREAEDMAARGEGDLAVTAVRERFQMLRAAERDLAAVHRRDARWKSDRDHLFQVASTPVTAVERDLQATAQLRSAEEVKALAAAYQADRRTLDPQLGVKPPAPPTPAPTPTPR